MPQLRISHFRQDRNFKLKVKAQIVEKIKILKYERFQTFYKSRKTKRDGCEKRNAFIETKTKCVSNLIRKATIHLQNQSKTPSF